MDESSRRAGTRGFQIVILATLIAWASLSKAAASPQLPRDIPLDGPWQVTLAGEDQPRPITVPTSLEDGLQLNYDGVSTWQRTVEPTKLEPGQRLLIQFEAVATHAKISLQGEPVGEHLGGWTPFEFDVTEIARRHADAKEWTLQVEVDERVGHNTQGFLPIITHHFGGIWQPVRLRVVNDVHIDQINLHVQGIREPAPEGNAAQSVLVVDVAVAGNLNRLTGARIELAIRKWSRDAVPADESEWQNLGVITSRASDPDANSVILRGNGRIPVPEAFAWSPDSPNLYEVRVQLLATDETGNPDSTVVLGEAVRRTGFATVHAEGRKLLLNDEQLIVRGLLNWGYAPPLIAPSLDEKWMRDEIEFAKDRGFNLMKFCLWVPPKRYLELCDEMGLLAWVEYPTWHPQLDQVHRDQLLAEYREFFAHDRNHPCVALRSLTCETGPSADLEVIRDLYNLGKAMVPGAMIEDDSSWIGWNRIHDFYDDHPYGNNHTWRETLARLNAFVDEHGAKPLVLGEAIAADTWDVDNPWREKSDFLQSAHERLAAAANDRWLERMIRLAESTDCQFEPDFLINDSFAAAIRMRKFQIEMYCRDVPYGGYVVSVIRDFPKASMGLISSSGEPKVRQYMWQFQKFDPMVLLKTPADVQSVTSGTSMSASLIINGPLDDDLPEASLTWVEEPNEIGFQEKIQQFDADSWKVAGPDSRPEVEVSIAAPAGIKVPMEIELSAQFKGKRRQSGNSWVVYAVPAVEWPDRGVLVSETLRTGLGKSILGELPTVLGEEELAQICIDDSLDQNSIDFLRDGGRILLLPNAQAGSLALDDHWFLRSGPAWFIPARKVVKDGRVTTVTDSEDAIACVTALQPFDLAGPVIPRIDAWLDRIEPRLLLWDNHDLAECRTHGLWFSMAVGDKGGRLMVSALNHFGKHNAVGEWLLKKMAHELTEERVVSKEETELGLDNLRLLERSLFRRELQLANESWEFRPDPDGVGKAEKWELAEAKQEISPGGWQPIRIGEHWESQGHEALDGWGWYRTRIAIPESWPADKAQLVFTGVDDCCLVYVNGELAGKCGDAETRESAFDLQTSIDLSSRIKPGATIDLVIAVYDWQGAGGLFRPIVLATDPPDELSRLIVPLGE